MGNHFLFPLLSTPISSDFFYFRSKAVEQEMEGGNRGARWAGCVTQLVFPFVIRAIRHRKSSLRSCLLSPQKANTRRSTDQTRALPTEWRKKEAQVLSAKNKVHLYFDCAKKAARYPCVCAREQFFLLFKLFCWPQKSEKRLPPLFLPPELAAAGESSTTFFMPHASLGPERGGGGKRELLLPSFLPPPSFLFFPPAFLSLSVWHAA